MNKKIKTGIFLWMMLVVFAASGVIVHGAEQSASTENGSYCTVTFRTGIGKLIRRETVTNGKTKLPAMKNKRGYTFLGWSLKPGQQTNPDYQAGEIINITGKTNLYAVNFKRSNETDIPPSELAQIDTGKYSKVIFVGDSRTTIMRLTLYKECGRAAMKNVAFVNQSGRGLEWFKTEGIYTLMRKIKEARAVSNKPVAIVFNLGVNDLYRKRGKDVNCPYVIRQYVSYMNWLGEKLDKRGCRLFYMSVNPYNSTMLNTPKSRLEEDGRTFNRGLRNGLDDCFTYLNTYGWLMRSGYSTDHHYGINTGDDDGLHYTTQTYKRIYQYCINKVNRM